MDIEQHPVVIELRKQLKQAAKTISERDDRIELLEFYVQELTTGVADSDAMVMYPFHLSVTLRHILDLLVNRSQVTKELIYTSLYCNKPESDQAEPKIIDVYVCKLRQILKPYGVTIDTVWGRGYVLSPENRELLLSYARTHKIVNGSTTRLVRPVREVTEHARSIA